jgi:nitrogen-specific signal transduction histidine kinase
MSLLARFTAYSAKPALAGAWGVVTYAGLAGLILPSAASRMGSAAVGTGRSIWVLRDGAPVEVAVEIGAGCEAGVITVTVADDGPGIPVGILPTIFEPNVTTKKSRGRRGLGLHIVQSIVAEHGGTVEARNHQPTGAIFTVRLPQAGLS